jgi:N-acetylmuramic acid 6-phosphate etherase
MSNLQAKNMKLRDRAVRIVSAETGLDQAQAERMLAEAGSDLRVALVMIRSGVSKEQAIEALEAAGWIVEKAAS